MSNFMHLTFEERCKIEELLNKRYRKYQIAKEIGKTPYEVFTFLYGKETAKKLNIQKIRKDDVTLTPSLLK